MNSMPEQKKSTIIYLIGNPGVGKYTIAQELSKQGYIVCDNQLINNPIFSLLNYDGLSRIPEFAWDAIGNIRKAVFAFIAMEPDNNYALTNCLYENEGDRECYEQVVDMAKTRGSLFVPIKVILSREENLKRIKTPSRRSRWKSVNPEDVSPIEKLIDIEHPNLLELDVTNLSASQAASKILKHISKIAC